jgi:hypothetical protein
MEHLEVVIYDEIDDYSEKIKGLTFRQWIFVAITILVVVPTYLLIPKYTPISKDLVSYLVIIEAAIIGFLGFVKIQNLNAEQIMPFWYRHFIVYKKPIEYMTDQDWEKAHQPKNKKSSKNNNNQKDVSSKTKQEDKQESKPIVNTESAVKSKSETTLTKKQLKQKKKQEKMLKKAQAKYKYMFDEADNDNQTVEAEENIQKQELVSEAELTMNEMKAEPKEKIKETQGTEVEENLTNAKNNKIDDVFKSLSPEEKKDLLKKLVNDE